MEADDIVVSEARDRIEAARRARAASSPTTPGQRRAERLAKRKAAEFEAGPGVTVRNGYGDGGATERFEAQNYAASKSKKRRRRRRR